MSVFEFGSDRYDINAIADELDSRGWKVDRQDTGLHLMLSPYHARVADRFVSDLAESTADHGESTESNTTYGGIA